MIGDTEQTFQRAKQLRKEYPASTRLATFWVLRHHKACLLLRSKATLTQYSERMRRSASHSHDVR